MARRSPQLSKEALRNFLGFSGLEPLIDRALAPHNAAEVETSEEWLSAYLEIMDAFPDKLTKSFPEVFHGKCVIDGVFGDGMIHGRCVEDGRTYNVFANHPGSKPLVGCNCADSQGQYPCWHIWMFLYEVTDELEDYYSRLSYRVRRGQFDAHKPNAKLFAYDELAEVKRQLQELIPAKMAQESADDDVDEASLAPLDTAQPARIAWNVGTAEGRLTITPMLQQAKKRGGGWTKGRKINLETLAEHLTVLSDADRRVRELVTMKSYSYRPTFHLDSVEACLHLMGEPNVMLDGVPSQIEPFDPTVRMRRDNTHCWLTMKAAVPQASHFVISHQAIVHIRRDTATIQICRLATPQCDSLRSVVRFQPIPLKHEQALLETVKKLQALLTVELPESLAGKVVHEDYRPVLLLRSRSDGGLEYGFRLRDSGGHLRMPGHGVMIRAGERGGETVQIARSAVTEYALAQDVAYRFGLPSNALQGKISDFEQALQLIEKLQAAELNEEVEILWDKASEKPVHVLGAVTTQNVSVGISSKRDWFQLSGSCDFGKESVELSELLSGLQSASGDGIRGDYVRLGDKGWARISQALRVQLQQIHDSVNHERGGLNFDATSAPAIRGLVEQQVELKANQAWNKCLAQLARAEKLEPVLPQSLNAELRDYQTEGFRWLRRLAEWGVGGVLADDMGLGKTLQTLAVLLDRAQRGPALVIAPTSVGFNWIREAQKFAPSLEAHLYRETDRAEFLQQVGPGSLVVCSYGLALRDAEALASVTWDTLVLDEAQAIKNSRSKTSAAIATIPADWKLALTGTPVENHLGELWSLFRIVSPGVLGGWEQFRRRFAGPIEKDDSQERRHALRERLKPFLLRRTKGQVLKDLPPRSETSVYVELSPAEQAVYNQVRLSAMGEIDQLAKLPDIQDQRFRILALLTRLRQLACSPKLVHETWKERSSKLQQLCNTVHELREEGHRVLIFSQFVQHLALIREMLDEEKISYEYLDGTTPAKARQQRVDSFQQGDATAFLISLKAGGTGLNLTAADYVIHMDPWWNPAVEDQATDRAHRIGQNKPVMVYRLVSQGTIEEEILRLHDTKRDLVAGIMEGTAAAAKLSTEDLINLVRGSQSSAS